MSSDMIRNTLLQLIQEIESNMTSQEDIDHVYSKLSSIYHAEMHDFFRSSNTYPGMKKKFYRKSRPFWNNDLQELWNEVRKTEHIFTKANGEANLRLASSLRTLGMPLTEYLGERRDLLIIQN